MCLKKLRGKCRLLQVKYEKAIAGKSVFGFSKLYTDVMAQIREREDKKHEGDAD